MSTYDFISSHHMIPSSPWAVILSLPYFYPQSATQSFNCFPCPNPISLNSGSFLSSTCSFSTCPKIKQIFLPHHLNHFIQAHSIPVSATISNPMTRLNHGVSLGFSATPFHKQTCQNNMHNFCLIHPHPLL